MRIIAIRSADPFTRISNTALRDARLSFKARGLLSYLLSHQDGFDLSVAALRAVTTDGKAAINTGLHELEALGYLARVQVRGVAGRLGSTHYAVADDPALLKAEDLADQIGGLLISRDARERYVSALALSDNQPKTPKQLAKKSDNRKDAQPQTSPPTENQEAVKNPKKLASKSDNQPKHPKQGGSSPLTDFQQADNRPLQEEQVLEEQKKTTTTTRAPREARSAAGDDVVGLDGLNQNSTEKAPTRPAATFEELADTIRPDAAPEGSSGPATRPTPKRPYNPADPSFPNARGRAELARSERMDISDFIKDWNAAIGDTRPWSATDTDLACFVLAHWTAGEVRDVLETMARGRRGISSPLRYFCAGLEKVAARAVKVAPRRAPAPLTGPPAPVTHNNARQRDPFWGMTPEQRARAEAEVVAGLRAKGFDVD